MTHIFEEDTDFEYTHPITGEPSIAVIPAGWSIAREAKLDGGYMIFLTKEGDVPKVLMPDGWQDLEPIEDGN